MFMSIFLGKGFIAFIMFLKSFMALGKKKRLKTTTGLKRRKIKHK